MAPLRFLKQTLAEQIYKYILQVVRSYENQLEPPKIVSYAFSGDFNAQHATIFF
jgi:hypothetical protein